MNLRTWGATQIGELADMGRSVLRPYGQEN